MSGFVRLLRAEWTKLRSVPGWLVGLAVVAVLTAGIGLLLSAGSVCSQPGPNGGSAPCTSPVGPGGQHVADRFYLVHRTLTGDGRLTVRLTALDAAAPWAKAGLIVKQSTRQGSAYAAVLATPGHGVRMQWNYTHDTAGPPGAPAPRWLRLTRAGDTVTGSASADGVHWTTVGTATLAGLPRTVPVGLFATGPSNGPLTQSLTGATQHVTGAPAATATFDHLDLADPAGGRPGGTWTGIAIGASTPDSGAVGFGWQGGALTVRGSGDIAPAVSPRDPITPIERTLLGVFAGLIAAGVVGAMFTSAEYRRGMIRTTMAASPGRGRVLAAKAVVVGAATFVVGLVGAAVAVAAGSRLLRGNGNVVVAVPAGTELRVIAGTAALLAATAVLALAVGTVLRNGMAAVAAVVLGLVLPYLLAVAVPVLPAGAANWLLRVSPAAGFAVQQTLVRHPQVDAAYTPFNGYFPLAPWTGLAVLGGYLVLALLLAAVLLRRRDV
jgi:ABC-type transport system involved in multi-copper enzyme maturation permease subunit